MLTDLDASIAALRPNQGKAYSVDENRQAILVYLQVRRQAAADGENLGKDAAITRAAVMLCRGARVLHNVVTAYETQGEIISTDPKTRGPCCIFCCSLCPLSYG